MIGEIKENTKGTKMMIIAERNRQDIDVEFLDSYHYIKTHTTYVNFRRGQIKNPFDKTVYGVGYVGDGKYLSKVNGEMTIEYDTWKGMLKRCYSETSRQKFESYYDISEVCEEWMNFQNFAEWYSSHKYDVDGRLHIDKDIKYPGNKLYSPYHCLLVPQRINMLFSNKTNSRMLPNGIRKEGNLYYAKYGSKELGSAATLSEAYSKYAEAKKKAIINIAEEYHDIIPLELYDALLNYEVRIENDKNYNNENTQ